MQPTIHLMSLTYIFLVISFLDQQNGLHVLPDLPALHFEDLQKERVDTRRRPDPQRPC